MWEFIHNVVAHPLLGLSFNADWAVRLHDWTSEKAWPVKGPQCASCGTVLHGFELRTPSGVYCSYHCKDRSRGDKEGC